MVDNAIKYSPDGSKIKIGICDSGCYWKIFVEDSGPGIPDDEKPYVFDRFKRNNKTKSGNGLGLSIVKKIIELHGGYIGVEDGTDGNGTMFWFCLEKSSHPS
ncbi:sensor histidine kinase [Methanohalobium evestigatum]|uniref:sensor histidine kinase n=1 Tax=Methanohalobium evestigatum TaxID=2322 RepID=UPI0006781EE5|nr:sensor histidine kinase [Methanohalobium evestigatum]